MIRETIIRWRKGWLSLLVLGAAYGIIEEGLMVKSFFDPAWQDIGILGSYGRWLGVNWIWSLELAIYHAVISISIPILLTGLIFPTTRSEKWLGRKALIIFLILFEVDVAFGYFFLTSYRPGVAQYWLAVAVVVVLILIAWRLPRQALAVKSIALKPPVRFWLLGFLAMIAFMIIFWVLPNTATPPQVIIFIGLLLVILVGWLVMRFSGNFTAWADTHKLALASGPLTVFILMTPIQEFDAARTDNTTGMAVVGLAALVFLVWLYWKTRRRLKEEANE